MASETQTIEQLIKQLPPEGQTEVRHFAEFLVNRKKKPQRNPVRERERGASPQEVLELIRSLPDIPAEDVDELMRLIKEGKRPADFSDPFATRKKKRR